MSRRDDKRKQREIDEEMEARLAAEKQDRCAHLFNCSIQEVDWQGRITEIVCNDCGAVNYIEHP